MPRMPLTTTTVPVARSASSREGREAGKRSWKLATPHRAAVALIDVVYKDSGVRDTFINSVTKSCAYNR